MYVTSHSELKLARKCSKAHDYKYNQKLKRRKPSRPAFIGTILHEMLDAYTMAKIDPNYVGDPWKVLKKYEEQYAKLFREEKEEFGDIPQMATRIFEGYLRRWRRDGYRYHASEVRMETDIAPGIKLVFIIDKILTLPDGRRFLMDHKFHRQIPGPEDRYSDIQTVLYFWGYNREVSKADQLDGIIWDYGRMKAPTEPELLKNGKELSRRANIDCDAHTYLEAIKRHGFKPGDYADFLKTLEGKERSFFERVLLPAPPKTMIEQVVEDARQTAVIRQELGRAGISPRDGMGKFNCKTCDFRTLCEAELRGLDADFVRKRDYEPRESTVREIIDAEDSE